MGIITISRGSYSKGKEIAEKLAEELGYECTSRDIILETSEHFQVPELKLVRAIHDAPSILDRFKYGKDKFVAYYNETFFEHIQRNNIVYHGLAGHFLLQNVPNILKVRIIANFEDRVVEEMKRENISEKEARHILKKDDEERRKWSRYVYGIDTNDAGLYDLILHIDSLKVEDAVEILVDIARRPCFQTTVESEKALRDQYLAAKTKVALLGSYPNAEVTSSNGIVSIRVEAALSLLSLADKVRDEVASLVKTVEGVEDVKIDVIPSDLD